MTEFAVNHTMRGKAVGKLAYAQEMLGDNDAKTTVRTAAALGIELMVRAKEGRRAEVVIDEETGKPVIAE